MDPISALLAVISLLICFFWLVGGVFNEFLKFFVVEDIFSFFFVLVGSI